MASPFTNAQGVDETFARAALDWADRSGTFLSVLISFATGSFAWDAQRAQLVAPWSFPGEASGQVVARIVGGNRFHIAAHRGASHGCWSEVIPAGVLQREAA